MSTLFVSEFVTLDGVMEAPGGEPTHPHTGWVEPYGVPEVFEYKLEEDAGRGVAAARPGHLRVVAVRLAGPGGPVRRQDERDAQARGDEQAGGADLERRPAAGDVPTAVRALKDGAGGPVLVAGSSTLVHTLLRERLVDELRLMVFRIAVGGGLRVFPDDRTKVELKLTGLVQYESGVLLQVYRVA